MLIMLILPILTLLFSLLSLVMISYNNLNWDSTGSNSIHISMLRMTFREAVTNIFIIWAIKGNICSENNQRSGYSLFVFIFILVFNGKGRWWFQLCYKYYNRLYFIVQILLSEKLAEKPQTDGLHNLHYKYIDIMHIYHKLYLHGLYTCQTNKAYHPIKSCT